MSLLQRFRRTSPADLDPSEGEPDRHARIPYEPALDGLRGLAVLAVVLFHAELVYDGRQWFGAGFLGVDAFFVLSGFLITALLLVERQSTGRIALGDFWRRRARRLLPALFAMVGVVALYAAFKADVTELAQIRRHGLASLAYLANWQFIRDGSSYFTQFETPSPFQHLWSLAIEEQWYVFWPLAVIGVLRISKGSARAVMWVSILGALASAALMAVLFEPGSDPSRVYFGTDTRAQSLLVGSAFSAALISGVAVPDWVARRALPFVASIIAVALGVLWVTGDWQDEWYYRGGFLALAVATGIVVVAAVQPEGNILRSALSVRPLVALGLISYGVYLWHWPVFLFVDRRIDLIEDWSFEAITALRLAVTLVVSIASYLVIERPIRRGALSRRVRFAPALIPITAAALVALLFVTTTTSPRPTLPVAEADSFVGSDGPISLPSRDDLEEGIDPTTRPMPDGAATTDATKVLVVGDSVAYTMTNGFTPEIQEQSDLMVWNQTVLFCELAEGPRLENGLQVEPSDTCADREREWRKDVEQFDPDVVVLQVGAWEIFNRKIDGEWLGFGSGEYNRYFTGVLEDAIETLSSGGATVVLLSSPHFERSDAMSAREWTQNETWRTTHINELFAEVAGEREDTVLLPLAEWLCPDGERCVHDLATGALVRYDGVHFTDDGAVAAAQWLGPQLRAVALSADPPSIPAPGTTDPPPPTDDPPTDTGSTAAP
jgi:peptidoglycan/LPS O-acetylase OafA/YrhL